MVSKKFTKTTISKDIET